MQFSNINLGYYIKRDILEPYGGARSALPCIDANALIIFPHDLKAFAIPVEYAGVLSEAYQRYLIASGILNTSILVTSGNDPAFAYDEEALSYDATTLALMHAALDVPVKKRAFNLDIAIGFVEEETGLSKTLAIRWCMMMEYISFDDQRLDMALSHKDSITNNNPFCQNELVENAGDHYE